VSSQLTLEGERSGLVLPGPLADVDEKDTGAWLEYGRRQVTWTLRGPGKWHLNSWSYAWIDVHEERPFAGEPLSLWATRRIDDSASRVSFTDKGRAAIKAEVLPVIARYGFDRLWMELTAAKAAASDFDRPIREAEARVEWWKMKRDLGEWMAAGELQFIGHDTDPVTGGHGEHRVRIARDYHHGGFETDATLARAMHGGEHVGWLLRGGEVVPLADVLEACR
jgi:hypothetical protein